jgi:hypothetical protein
VTFPYGSPEILGAVLWRRKALAAKIMAVNSAGIELVEVLSGDVASGLATRAIVRVV